MSVSPHNKSHTLKRQRALRLACYSLTIVFLCIWFAPALSPLLNEYGGDSAQYIVLAQSLLQGKGYRMINYPSEVPCTYYPFFFPLTLVPFLAMWGLNFIVLHGFVVMQAILYLLAIYWFLRQFTPGGVAIIVAGVVGLSTGMFVYTAAIRTTIPFAFLVLLTLIFLERYKKDTKTVVVNAFLCAFFLLSAYFTRTVGISLYCAAALYLLWKDEVPLRDRLKKVAFLSVCFLIPFVIWQVRSQHIHSTLGGMSHSYQMTLIDPRDPEKGTITAFLLLRRIVSNLNHYLPIMGAQLLCGLRSWFAPWFVVGLVACGWVVSIRRRVKGFDLFFAVYLGLICLWPWQERARFVLPVLFLAAYYLYLSLSLILTEKRKRLCVGLLALLLAGNMGTTALTVRRTISGPPHEFIGRFLSAHRWFNENVKEKGVVVSVKPSVTYLLTGHKAILYPLSRNPHFIWRELQRQDARYLIVDEFSSESRDYLAGFLSAYAQNLRLLYTLGDSAVFVIMPGQK